MASTGTLIKREATTQAWVYWINSITGENPNVDRHANGVDISFKEGQAKAMENYFAEAMKPSEGNDPESLNVSVPLGPVLIPLAIKKSLGYVAMYTAIVVIGTKLIWK